MSRSEASTCRSLSIHNTLPKIDLPMTGLARINDPRPLLIGDNDRRDLFPLCVRGRARSPNRIDRFSKGNAYAQKLMMSLDGCLDFAVLSILDNMEEV
jgi:hypothetical protein